MQFFTVNQNIKVYFGDGSGCWGPLEGKLLSIDPDEDENDYYKISVIDSKFLDYVDADEWIVFAAYSTDTNVTHVPYDDFIFTL